MRAFPSYETVTVTIDHLLEYLILLFHSQTVDFYVNKLIILLDF